MSTAYKKMTSHGSISIPVTMRRELGIEPKDPMIVDEHQGEIRIKPYTLRCNFCMSFMGRVSVKPVQQKHLRS